MERKLARYREILSIAVILFVGIFLRFFCLAKWEFWRDELHMLRIITQNDYLGIIQVCKHDAWPFLYPVLLKYATSLFGLNEFGLRFSSAIFGSISILCVYMLAKRMFNHKTALISSLCLAISWVHIYYSQDAMMYAFFTFLVLITMYFFIEAITRNNFLNWLGYLSFSILVMYTHYYFIFLLLIQWLYLSIMFKKYRSRIIAWFVVQVFLGLVFYPWTLHTNIIVKTFPWISPVGPKIFLYILGTFAFSVQFIPIFILFIFLSFLPPKLLGRTGKSDKSEDNRDDLHWILLLLLWFVVPLVGALIYSIVVTPILVNERYILFSLPAFFILASRGIDRVSNRNFRILLIFTIIALSIQPLCSYYTDTKHPPWNAICRYVYKNNLYGNTLVLVNPRPDADLFRYYYLKANNYQVDNQLSVFGIYSLNEIMLMQKNRRELWVILCLDYNEKLREDFFTWVIKKTIKVKEMEYFQRVIVFHTTY